MKIIFNKSKATNIKIAYYAFVGLYIIGYLFQLKEIILMAVIASGGAWGMYTALFIINFKYLKSKNWLTLCNVLFLFTNLGFVYYAFENPSNIAGFVLACSAIILFSVSSNKTLNVLLNKYELG